jgi:hypothetical protein
MAQRTGTNPSMLTGGIHRLGDRGISHGGPARKAITPAKRKKRPAKDHAYGPVHPPGPLYTSTELSWLEFNASDEAR